MTAIRTKPEITKESSNDSGGCLWFPFQILMWVIVIRVLSGMGTPLEKNLCVGLGIVFLILLFRNEAKEKQAKEKWRATCTVAWLTIVKRHCYPGGSYVDEYEIPNSSRPSYYLELELNADQSMVAPTEKVVRVDIGGALYNTLLNRKTVCIYYQSEKPLSFFIAEEF